MAKLSEKSVVAGRGLSRRLAEEFRIKIANGEWAVGHRLPTTRTLARQYQVSLNTVQSAFRELEAVALVDRAPGRGGVVLAKAAEREAPSQPARKPTEIGVLAPIHDGDSVLGADDWYSYIIRATERALLSKGFHVSMFSYDASEGAPLQRLLERVDNLGPALAGMLCFPWQELTGLLTDLDRRNVPWVTINRSSEGAGHNFVAAENFEGSRRVGRCFAKLGVKRALVLASQMQVGRSDGDKLFGFIQGFVESGRLLRDVDYVAAGSASGPAVREQLNKYCDEHGVPDAIYAVGDLLALEALTVCRERGLRVPEQVGILSGTGLHVAEHSDPPLSVLAQPMDEMGMAAADMLLQMINDGTRRVDGKYVQSPLIVRRSLPIPEEVLEASR